MFGKIRSIDNNEVVIENIGGADLTNLMNCHLIFEGDERKVVGEVILINESITKVLLIGEIINNKFNAGVVRKPNGNSKIRVITLPELELIFGKSELTKDRLFLGKSAIYKNFNISVSLNDFFASHNAIIGNTGSGKSCGVAKILQNLFLSQNKPVNSHIVLFDAYTSNKWWTNTSFR